MHTKVMRCPVAQQVMPDCATIPGTVRLHVLSPADYHCGAELHNWRPLSTPVMQLGPIMVFQGDGVYS